MPNPNTRGLAESAFGSFLGLRIVTATADGVEAELDVLSAFANRNGVMHGGAIMAFADYLGGTATLLALGEDQTTTTIESKTQFFAPVPIGGTLRGLCHPLHRGRTLMTWQTDMIRPDGRRAALTIQTQLVMARQPRPSVSGEPS